MGQDGHLSVSYDSHLWKPQCDCMRCSEADDGLLLEKSLVGQEKDWKVSEACQRNFPLPSGVRAQRGFFQPVTCGKSRATFIMASMISRRDNVLAAYMDCSFFDTTVIFRREVG